MNGPDDGIIGVRTFRDVVDWSDSLLLDGCVGVG